MFDQDTRDEVETVQCQACGDGGVYCDEQSGDWICENCGQNYSQPGTDRDAGGNWEEETHS